MVFLIFADGSGFLQLRSRNLETHELFTECPLRAFVFQDPEPAVKYAERVSKRTGAFLHVLESVRAGTSMARCSLRAFVMERGGFFSEKYGTIPCVRESTVFSGSNVFEGLRLVYLTVRRELGNKDITTWSFSVVASFNNGRRE